MNQHYPSQDIGIVTSYQERQAWIFDLARRREYTVSCRLCGLMLAEHLNIRSGQLFPSYGRLAECIGQTDQAAINHVAAMERGGRLLVFRSRGRVSNQYALVLPPDPIEQGDHLLPSRMANPHPSLGEGYQPLIRSPRNHKHSGRHPSTLVAPNLNNSENLRQSTGDVFWNSATIAAAAALSWEPKKQELIEIVGTNLFDCWLGAGMSTLRLGPPVAILVRCQAVAHVRAKFGAAFDQIFGGGSWSVIGAR